ncbi:MAG: 2-amino-4-hydroxy-6-hydroxymethyldihydropteridine diphosphokinase [Rhodothermales bacterium]|nr:2-amino-4-hydroxy-6-hydroxymethyldihydropteridine diphosphokinase [Rhodothermales bacterium]
MSVSNLAYAALGSNTGDRFAYLVGAVQALEVIEGITVVRSSPVYESAAMTLGEAQPEYLNAVLELRTNLEPKELLARFLEIESHHGRERSPGKRWESRTLDIDLLLYGQEQIEETGLTVPHPHLAERRFVLKPLADLAPNLFVPGWSQSVGTLLRECQDKTSLQEFDGVLLDIAEPPRSQAELWPQEKAGVRARIDSLPKELRYVVIEGVIGAGKTTLARMLSRQFDARLVLEEFEENPFLERFYADRPRWAFQTQLAFLASRFRQQQGLGKPDLFHETVVSDYMFDKDRLFAQQNLAGDELALYDTMFGIMQASVPQPDLIVYLQSSTDRLMRLIARRGRSYEQDMDRDYIHSLNQAYESFFFRYNTTPLLIVNTEQIDFVHSEEDFREIVEQVARVGYAGTTYFNPARV